MAESSFEPRSHLTSAFAFVSNFKMDFVPTNDGVSYFMFTFDGKHQKNTIRHISNNGYRNSQRRLQTQRDCLPVLDQFISKMK